MSVNAIDSQSVTIGIGAGSPISYTTIPEVSNLNIEGAERPDIDVSDLSSTAREYKLGLKDPGNCTFDLMWRPDHAQHIALRNAFNNNTLTSFRITFTDASPVTTWTFNAYVKSFPVSANIDDVVKANISLRITGSITEA